MANSVVAVFSFRSLRAWHLFAAFAICVQVALPFCVIAQDACIRLERAVDASQSCALTDARVTIALRLECHSSKCTDESGAAVTRLNSLLMQNSRSRVRAFGFVTENQLNASELTNLFYDWHLSFPLCSGHKIPHGSTGTGPVFLAFDAKGRFIGFIVFDRSAASLAFFLNSIDPPENTQQRER